MDASKLTTKSQEALADAIRRAVAPATRTSSPCTCCRRCWSRPAASPLRCSTPSAWIAPRVAAGADALLRQLPSASGATVASPEASRATLAVLSAAGDRAARDRRRVRRHRAPARRARPGRWPGRRPAEVGRHLPEELLEAFPKVRGAARVTSADPEGDLPGAGEVRHRPDRARARRRARPGHRPGRRDPPGRAGAVATHEEQPGADRRARRRQDRRRRGTRAAHRRRATSPTR